MQEYSQGHQLEDKGTVQRTQYTFRFKKQHILTEREKTPNRLAAMSHTEPLAPTKSSTTEGHKRLAAKILYL